MKKIWAILAISTLLVACNYPSKNMHNASYNFSSSDNQTHNSSDANSYTSQIVTQLTEGTHKYFHPKVIDNKINLETEYFSLKLPKDINITQIFKYQSDIFDNITYGLLFGNTEGGYHVTKISQEYSDLIKKCEKIPADSEEYFNKCKREWLNDEDRSENIIKNAQWQEFVISGIVKTPEETKKGIEIIKNNIQFHTTEKAESAIEWKSDTYQIPVIKPQIIDNKTLFRTNDFEVTLPLEFKDSYLEVMDNNIFALNTKSNLPYFLIAKVEKQYIDHAKECDKKYPQPREGTVSDDCIFHTFDEKSIIATFDNGDVLEYLPSIDTLPKAIQKYDEILQKYTQNSSKENIVPAYLKENTKILIK